MKLPSRPRGTRPPNGHPLDRPKPITVIVETAVGVILTAPILLAKDWIVRAISAPWIVKRCPVRGSTVAQQTVAAPTALASIAVASIAVALIAVDVGKGLEQPYPRSPECGSITSRTR
jgi:hypothetical protein